MDLITARTQKTPGPTVTINCPLCRAASAPAESFDQLDHLRLLDLVPLFRVRNTFLRCGACGKQLTAKAGIDQIANLSTDELSRSLAGRVSLISMFLAVASVLLCWMPILNLALAVIAILANLRTRGWPRTVSWIGGGLAVLVSLLFVLVLAAG